MCNLFIVSNIKSYLVVESHVRLFFFRLYPATAEFLFFRSTISPSFNYATSKLLSVLMRDFHSLLYVPIKWVSPSLLVLCGNNFVESTLLKLDKISIFALANILRPVLILKTYQSHIQVSLKVDASSVILHFVTR